MDITKIKFKDIHSHILFGIDDGASSIEESLEIIKLNYKEGVSDIILTPHYMPNTKYVVDNNTKIKLVKQLRKKLDNENIDINLYLGNEIFINDNILEDLKNNKCMSLNNTKYVLVEMPIANYMSSSLSILFDLIRNGYVPVLAHPERYVYFQRDYDLIDKYLDLGVLLQGNYKSLFGKYGKYAKRLLTKLLKEDKITFLGSDIHHVENYDLKKMYKKLKKIIKDEDVIKDITANNYNLLIKNKDI